MSGFSKIMNNEYLTLIARIVIGGIFIYASLDKIASPAQFARVIYNYHLLPGDLINLAAILMPWVEMISGIAVVLGLYKRGGLLILNFLLIVFMIAIAVNVFRGVDLECGCFTVSSRARGSALSLLYRDFGMLVIALFAWFSRATRFQISKN